MREKAGRIKKNGAVREPELQNCSAVLPGIVLLLVAAGTLFLLCFGRVIPSPVRIEEAGSTTEFLAMDGDLFYRQTLNNCGAYSVMAVLAVLRQEEQDPELLAQEMRWRIYKNLTFPYGVQALLRAHGIRADDYVLRGRADKKKLDWLKGRISEGSPVVLLIKIHHVLHYVTVLGYDADGFMLYDSMQEKDAGNPQKTIVDGRCLSGNRYYRNDELAALWNAGGYKIFFRNWAIVCRR